MRRDEAEHVLRAARVILSPKGDTRFIVVGSQSILGAHPNAPAELLLSMELDPVAASYRCHTTTLPSCRSTVVGSRASP